MMLHIKVLVYQETRYRLQHIPFFQQRAKCSYQNDTKLHPASVKTQYQDQVETSRMHKARKIKREEKQREPTDKHHHHL